MVDRLDLEQLLANEPVDPGFSRDPAQLGDPLLEIGELVLDPLALEPGQALEAKVEDGLRLDLRELELALKTLAGLVRIGRAADQRDNRVEIVERDQVALENMSAGFRLAQFEPTGMMTSRWKSR